MSTPLEHTLAEIISPAPVFIVITGPSGVGKDSVIAEMKRQGASFHFVVTATDRTRRSDEVDGEDYMFVSSAEFERMIRAGELFEHAVVYGQYKGVPKAQVRDALSAGRDTVMRLDVQGAQTIQKSIPGAITVFLAPSSVEALKERLLQRGADSEEQMSHRLQVAIGELALAGGFDYVVVNHDGCLGQAAADVLAIIRAEKCRTGRRPVVL
ncbi:MAG: guanylate kinase [Chloroflexi bacterium]|nr:guanylate kinase [Chloroflexota bacterium]